MSETETGRPEGLTNCSGKPVEIDEQQRRPGKRLGTGFAGSPTITADGADIFPDGAPSRDLACRMYPTPAGHAGVPTVDQVKEALTNHGL